MAENETPEPESSGFESKPLQTPSLDSETREHIGGGDSTAVNIEPISPNAGGGFVGFLNNNKFYIIAGLIGVVIIAIVGFFIFRGNEQVSEAKIDMQIDVPGEISANSQTIIKVNIQNKDSDSLVKPELEIIYPESLKYVNSTPASANITGSLFSLGDIGAGQSLSVLIQVKAEGSIGQDQNIVAKLRYKYKNFSSDFVKEATNKTVLVASGLQLNLQGPSSVNNSELVTYTLDYANDSDYEFKNSRIEFEFPSGFTFAGSEPEPSIGKNVWSLPQLSPGFKGKISIQGKYSSATPGEQQTVKVQFLAPDSTGTFRVQAEGSTITSIQSQPLLVTHELSYSNENMVVSPGDNVSYRVRYQNNATLPARAVNIVVSLRSKGVDLNSIRAEGAQVSGSTITWNAASFRNLEVVNPNESGEFEFSFNVNDPPVRDSSTNIDINTSIKIKSNEYDTYLPGNELQVKVRSISSLEKGLEFQSGALPPRVGNTTVYTASLGAKNLTNNFDNCVLTAFVAVDPTGFASGSMQPSLEASRTNFDSKTGKITWNLGQLKAHTGDFSEPRTLKFTLSINPSSSQSGDSVTLVKDIKATCTDSFTGEEINLTSEDLTTDDIGGSGYEGRVVN